MTQPEVGLNRQVIDLISDNEHEDYTGDEEDGLTDDENALRFPWSFPEDHPFDNNAQHDLNDLRVQNNVEVNDASTIDLTAIPDISIPPPKKARLAVAKAATELITAAVCLRLVLDIFPDVSVDHVLGIIQQTTNDLTRTKKCSERIVHELLEGTYPKEADAAGKKRPRGDSDYERDIDDPGILTYDTDA